MPTLPHTAVGLLAQQNPAQATRDILLWAGVGFVLILVLGLLVLLALRLMNRPPAQGPPLGFSLAELKQMHTRGQLTDEEFARARAAILSRTRADIQEPEPAAGGGDAAEKPPSGPDNPNLRS